MKKILITFLSFLLLAGCSNQGLQKENTNETITYQNAKYGFSLDYPKDWLLNQSPDTATVGKYVILTFISPERKKRLEESGGYEMASADMYISVFESSSELPFNANKKLSLEEWLQQEGSGQGLFSIQKTTFANSPAFELLSGSIDEADPEIYMEHNGRIYVIQNEIGDEAQRVRNEKIIQTFKWIN